MRGGEIEVLERAIEGVRTLQHLAKRGVVSDAMYITMGNGTSGHV